MYEPSRSGDSAHRKDCPWSILSLYLPSWLALLSPLKAGSKLTSGKVLACLPYLWPAGHHSQLAPKLNCFSASVSVSRPLVNVSAGLFFPAVPSGQQRAQPQRHQGTERGIRFSRPRYCAKPSSWVCLCETYVTQDAFLSGVLDLTCQQTARG